jgi:hypothetical protein
MRRMRWVVYVAQVGKMRNEHKILVGKPEGIKKHYENSDPDCGTILKCILQDVRVWVGIIWLRMRPGGGGAGGSC